MGCLRLLLNRACHVACFYHLPEQKDGTSGTGPLLFSGFIMLIGFREKDRWPF